MIELSPHDLYPHPRESSIYGDNQDATDLATKIKESGWIAPLVVSLRTGRHVIISGHRRWLAALELQLPVVPVEVQEFRTEEEELEALLLHNLYRDKTREQQVREGDAWREIEAGKSKARQGTRTDLQNNLVVNLPQGENGKTREKVAEKVGMKPSTYDRAHKVVRLADSLKGQEAEAEATVLLDILNTQSVDAAHKIMRAPESERKQVLRKVASGEAKDIVQALTQQKRETAAEIGRSANYPDLLSLHHADFRVALPALPAESVDLIFTDPPYDEQALELWEALALESARLLKPGGMLIAYSGQNFLDKVMALVGQHLDYYWLAAVKHTHGQLRLWNKKAWNSWKPVILWTKGKSQKHEWFVDLISMGDKETKDLHEWSQPITEASYFIERFSEPGQLVADPMCGAGTIPIAAAKLGRRAIGYEIDETRLLIARGRAQEVLGE